MSAAASHCHLPQTPRQSKGAVAPPKMECLFQCGSTAVMGNSESQPVRNVDKRTARRDHAHLFKGAITKFRQDHEGDVGPQPLEPTAGNREKPARQHFLRHVQNRACRCVASQASKLDQGLNDPHTKFKRHRNEQSWYPHFQQARHAKRRLSASLAVPSLRLRASLGRR